MEENTDNGVSENLGKIKGLKPIDKKWDSTKIDYFSVDDIYCDIKKIKISKKDLLREGENGLKVPEKFLNFEKCGISYEKLVQIFINSSEVTFNTSNQFPSEPVSFSSKFYNDVTLFINLHQFLSYSSSKTLKLCEDKSNIKVGLKTYEIGDESLKKFIDYLKVFFNFHVFGQTSGKDLLPLKKDNFLSKIKNFIYKKNKIDDFYLERYLINNKKINIIKVYP
jgi:hypothetical protein